MTYKEIGGYYVNLIEERRGAILDNNGYVQDTYNCYAGIGYELDEDDKLTGKVVAWAGNNAAGEVEVTTSDNLDIYLRSWDQEWIEQFEVEVVLEAKK